MEQYWSNLKAFVWNLIWAGGAVASTPRRAATVHVLRVVHMLGRELSGGLLSVRAASLVYTTLLSMIPALAVSFAVLKAFNVHQQLEPTLLRFLSPLGEKSVEIGTALIAYVEGLDLTKLGSVGVVFLIVTIVSLLHKVEQALNSTWRVERSRRFFERLSGYLTVVMIGPVLVFAAMGIVASIMRSSLVQEAITVELLGFVVSLATKLLPYLLVIAAFAFLYLYIPNTKVRVRSALVGAVVAGVLWASVGWLFASFVVTSARNPVIYSSLAILVLFMMWLYLAWLIVLVGGAVAFYHQHPEYLGLLTHELKVSNRVRERIGLTVCLLIAAHYHNRLPAWTAVTLARRLRVPLGPLGDTLKALERRGVLVATAAVPPTYVPARSLGAIGLDELLAEIRSIHETAHLNPQRMLEEPAVDALLSTLNDATVRHLAGRTLEDLVVEHGPMNAQAPLPESPVSDSPPEPVAISTFKRDGARR